MEALLAALLSGVMVAGGASLLYVTGGAALGPMVLGLYSFWTWTCTFPGLPNNDSQMGDVGAPLDFPLKECLAKP